MTDRPTNYTLTHLHTWDSILDSATDFKEYADLVKASGGTAIASTEHGLPRSWVSKKLYCDKIGLRFLFGVEIYLTEKMYEYEDADDTEWFKTQLGRDEREVQEEHLETLESRKKKVRDNYHTILIAKNIDGVREICNLMRPSTDDDHRYYANRITFEEFINLSPNVITTSACLAGPLNRLDESNPWFPKLLHRYDYLEVQPHLHPEQHELNKKLARLSKQYHIPLIAGTDTHSSTAYKSECRDILLAAKHQSYGDEDAFDLSYKTLDELIALFEKQRALTQDEIYEAISNTNALADSCEDFELDTSIKYPILYGSAEKDAEMYEKRVWEFFEQKLEDGIIPRDEEAAYRAIIPEELSVLKKLGMSGFMLSMSELICWCRENDIQVGPGRGSVGGSRTAYITGITDIDAEKWHTVFSRFANADRVEVGDIDTDVITEDRPRIFEYIVSRFGKDKTARVASYGTIKGKGVIDEVCRAKMYQWNEAHGRKYDDKGQDNPYNYDFADKIKDELPADVDDQMEDIRKNGESVADKDWFQTLNKKYPEIFYYFDGLWGVKISQSVHPAGMVISPIDLGAEYGTFEKGDDICLLMDMNEAHDVGAVKYDFLGLKSVKVIRDCCRYAGIPYPRTHEINFEDQNVWADIRRDQNGLFQFESAFGADSLKTMGVNSIADMSLVMAGIRPGSASYRDKMFKKEIHKNPSPILDELLKENYGYLVYQEDTLRFLTDVCGLSGSRADTIRRAISHKDRSVLEKSLPDIINGYCKKSGKPRQEAEQEVNEFVQVIIDSSKYQFNYSHSVAYCILSYFYGYLKYYHPMEFATAFLNNAMNDDDIATGQKILDSYHIKQSMPTYGRSKADYYFDNETMTIFKGIESVKFMNSAVANELYGIAHNDAPATFMDLLGLMRDKSSINSRQREILVKIDFFKDFGNMRELMRMLNIFTLFKDGEAKKMAKDKLTPDLLPVVSKYGIDKNKDGSESKSYTITDMPGLLAECEATIKQLGIPDADIKIKMQNQLDYMGYIDLTTNKKDDRCKLLITDVYPMKSKSSGEIWGYALITRSIGTGKTARLTAKASLFNRRPVKKLDIIETTPSDLWKSKTGYWNIANYKQIA